MHTTVSLMKSKDIGACMGTGSFSALFLPRLQVPSFISLPLKPTIHIMIQDCSFFLPFFVNKDIKQKDQENKKTHQKIQLHQDHRLSGYFYPRQALLSHLPAIFFHAYIFALCNSCQ